MIIPMFPTPVALMLAKKAGIQHLTASGVDLHQAMADFQKVAVMGSYENAEIMLTAHIVKGELTDAHKEILKSIYEFTNIEINGIIFSGVGKVFSNSDSEQTKLAAARLLYELKNGDVKENDEKTIKKVIFELSKD
jgi:hypothetical protein